MKPGPITWLSIGCLIAARLYAEPAPWDGKTDLFVPKGTYYRCVLRTVADAQPAVTLRLALRDNAGSRAYVLSKIGSTREELRLGEATDVKRDAAKLAGTIVLPGIRATMKTGEPPNVTLTLDVAGKLENFAAPYYDTPPALAFWKPVFDGIRERFEAFIRPRLDMTLGGLPRGVTPDLTLATQLRWNAAVRDIYTAAATAR